MFTSARLKLTAWYVLTIMCITILFSVFIYRIISHEVERSLRIQQFRQLRVDIDRGIFSQSLPQLSLDPTIINEANNRIKLILVVIDTAILGIAGFGGYFLAGKTLQPIQYMVDEQNRFITDASHELHTPITSLRTSIEVNLRDKTLTAEKAKKVLKSNLEDVENLQSLSGELIYLMQYQQPNRNATNELFSLTEVITPAKENVARLADKKHIVLQSDTSDAHIEGDKKSLVELFTILLDNAIKYSPENTTVLIHTEHADSKVKISVEDQGIGIKKENLQRIFDRFYREDSSRTKQNVPGYGLGLSIAKRIVTLHNGTITVASTISKGTTFTVQLPRKD